MKSVFALAKCSYLHISHSEKTSAKNVSVELIPYFPPPCRDGSAAALFLSGIKWMHDCKD